MLSGFHFTPTGRSVCNCGSYVPQRVNVVAPGFGGISDPSPTLWYNPGSFAVPALGFQGNAGRNTVLGPGYQQVDISAIKEFLPIERLRVQFRAEFFNILNRANFGTPDMNISNVSAGAITSAYDGRDIQFALKLIW
jgi:hypothetical protein